MGLPRRPLWIDHQPNMGRVADAPLSTQVLWSARYIGYQDTDTPLQTQFATPASTIVAAYPLSSSDALGDAIVPIRSSADRLFGHALSHCFS